MAKPQISRRSFLIGLGGVATVAAGGFGLTQYWDQSRASLKLASLSDLEQAEPFDVCIIGSGPAGVILGQDLVNHGLRTVILESGPNLNDKSADARIGDLEVYQNSGSVQYPIVATRVRGLGGTSNIWTGRCVRFKPLDFEKNAYTPENAPWPITYSELEPYYDRAEQTLRVRGGALSDYNAPRKKDLPMAFRWGMSDLQSLLQEVGVTVDPAPESQTSLLERGPIRVARDFLPDFTASSHATLISGATVTQLIAASNGSIVGAEARNFDGEVLTIPAQVYVVACGAIETVRLLLLSRSEKFPSGIGNGSNQVGRYFMEHPGITFRGEIPDMETSHFELGHIHQFYEEFKQRGLGDLLLTISRNVENPKLLRISAGIEMFPSATNRVTLSKDLKDYFGNPAAELSLSLTEHDLKTFDQARILVQQIYADLGAEVVKEIGMSWSHHHMGPCRMGDNPQTSVTDRNLRVHETPNLYIAGSAAFVTSGSGSPTLAIAALSHRLADHLVTILKS